MELLLNNKKIQKVKADSDMPSAALKHTDYVSDEFQGLPDDANLTVGNILKSTRGSRNETLEAVSHALRISEAYLEALESDDRDRLPEQVYTIGFLKTYAQYLNLDQDTLVVKFKKQFLQSVKSEALVFPAPAPERSIPTSTLVMIATGLALLIVMAWLYLKPASQAIDEFEHLAPVEEVEPAAVEAPEPAASVVEAEPAPVATAEPAKVYTQAYPTFPVPDARPYSETRAEKIKVLNDGIYLGEGTSFIVLARDESWVEIKSEKGQVLLSKTLKAGESQELEVQPGQTFSTGNAAGVSFYVNGKYYAELGKQGEIIRGKTLHFSAAPVPAN